MTHLCTYSLLRHFAQLLAVGLVLLGPLAHAGGKLVDGFGADQVQGAGVVTGADILTGSRDLWVWSQAADAVRVEEGRLWVDTQTLRVVARYTTVAPGTLHNFALDEIDNHGDWLVTYRSTQAATLSLIWRTEPTPGGRPVRDSFTVALAPSPDFLTLNLGTLVAPEFALYRTSSFSLQLDFVPAPGIFELDSLAIAAPVPEPATAALWLAGLAATFWVGRRASPAN